MRQVWEVHNASLAGRGEDATHIDHARKRWGQHARGEKAGRIYRTIAVGGGAAWTGRCTGSRWNHPRARHAPIREAAQAAFKAAWARCEVRMYLADQSLWPTVRAALPS
jgi:hypothetical protein